ncbi:MAG: bifunctional phosphoribosylaminoimidazolecarboxamide formyltransferase/IMP cyclohydrolase [Rikenellaceae bacterium]|jgi:phosphoribosylaminoimidazolecarboxamide formyltransferase/IMP cyclohydrolase|nr:bifunctional phosphoribosylaminoimidazolecarboxamide formyltransferase/IMP cyclohydrolase [Rikenellaceae bacterium]
MNQKKIKSALISVFYKDGLDDIVRELVAAGVQIYSTGGTLKFIEELGVKATAVEELTGYPSILGGRVKTLHPGVFGGILARRDNPTDGEQLAQYTIPEIDLVIVDLYPFEETVASGAEEQAVVEKIDIGGISLIRAGAKNFKDVVIVGSQAQYGELLGLLKAQDCSTTLEQRRRFAALAFGVSSHYDSAIFNYFNHAEGIPAFRASYDGGMQLRYGENPHQKGAFYGRIDEVFEQLHGKEISYNNLLDIDAAVNLIAEFGDEQPTFAILKHNNACGVGVADTVLDAWNTALASDPVSAFGGVLICNRAIDVAAAEDINKLFFEVILAPSYETGALDTLFSKKNRIVLRLKEIARSSEQFRSLLNGVAVQERDLVVGGVDSEMKTVTRREPTPTEIADMVFANKIVKQSKSNAIVLARGGQLLASGIGQTSRVDALRQAIDKAKSFGFDLAGVVMASDAFFPFADCVEIAHGEGITAVIQPGGSVRDGDSIEYCDAHDMAMVFTGLRHFKH